MSTSFKKCIFTLIGLLLYCHQANSMNIDIVQIDNILGYDHTEIQITGTIDAKSPKQLQSILNKIPTHHHITINLHSPGGLVIEAIEMAYMIRKRHADTNVAIWKNTGKETAGECYSACIYLLIGGVLRSANKDSLIGVHQFSNGQRFVDSSKAQELIAQEILLFKNMGVDSSILATAKATPNQNIHIINHTNAHKSHLLFTGKTEAIWSIEQIGNHFYLKGEQTYWTGTNKIMFLCETTSNNKKLLHLVAMSDLGEKRTQEILQAKPSTIVQLLIDDQPINLPNAKLKEGNPQNWLIAEVRNLSLQQIQQLLNTQKLLGILFLPHIKSNIFWGGYIELNDQKKFKDFLNHCLPTS